MFFSSVDANTGSYVVFDKDASDFSKAIVSSASIPFAFPSQNWVCIHGHQYFDINKYKWVSGQAKWCCRRRC